MDGSQKNAASGGDPDTGGWGFQLKNADSVGHWYFVYENSRDTIPWKAYMVS
jgi:hypothetical protein